MRIIIGTAIALCVLATAPAVALAGEGCTGMSTVARLFDASDTDDSGTLSAEEYAKAGLERFGVPFAEYDANGDGETSLDEYLGVFDRYHSSNERVDI